MQNLFASAGETIAALIRSIPKRPRGQGLIETALLFPVLLVVLSGLVEFGFLLNDYLALQDAARNAARFASDGLYYSRDADYNCKTTKDFYRQAACLVNLELAQERPQIEIDVTNGHDDIIISGFSISRGIGVTARHPVEDGSAGWSYAEDTYTYNVRNQSSRIATADINSRLSAGAPSTGLVSIEIFYHYDQKLKLPWVTAFLSDPLPLHNYTIMPLVSAEPTPTPIPAASP